MLGYSDVLGPAPATVIQFLLSDADDGPMELCLVLETGEANWQQEQIHARAIVQLCPFPRGATLERTSMLIFTSPDA